MASKSFKISKKMMLASFLISSLSTASDNPIIEVIYGKDDRKDLYQVSDQPMLDLADSTVGLIPARSISVNTDDQNFSTIKTSPYTYWMKPQNKLCTHERFYGQATGPFCSGSLIGEDLILTAGHCLWDQKSCDSTRFVFGFAKVEKSTDVAKVKTSDVYSCKKLLHTEYSGDGADFALVQLDRKVTDHAPLTLNRSGVLNEGTKLVVIGHPMGLPTKVAGGAQVKDASPNEFFTADLDTYGGNSGSAVFNTNTLEIEGVLVRGALDYVKKNGCFVSNVCDKPSCKGEDVTKISQVVARLNDSIHSPSPGE